MKGRRGEMGMTTTDEALRSRLTEIFASAGVNSSRASLEVMYLLPQGFLTPYAELFDRALKLDNGGRGDAGDVGKRSAGRAADKGKRPMVGSGSGAGAGRYKSFWVVKSEGLLDAKHRADKRLRALGREIRLELDERLDGAEAGKIRCARCGRIMSRDWNFCAGCGNHRPVAGE